MSDRRREEERAPVRSETASADADGRETSSTTDAAARADEAALSACGCGEGSCCDPGPVGLTAMPRRDFVRTAAVGGMGLALRGSPIGSVVAGPFLPQDRIDHFVPADKKLSPEWVRTLFARGASTWYTGSDLATIGMPVGGLCAGQVYLTGDGRLVDWHVFNENQNTGYGATNYEVGRAADETVSDGKVTPSIPVAQGFAVRVEAGGRTFQRSLDSRGFPEVRFCGEYPIARVEYVAPDFPVEALLEAFSPFVPLDAEASTLPATVLRYTVKNTGAEEAEVTLAGWLENVACVHHASLFADRFRRVNGVIAPPGMVGVVATARDVPVSPRGERTPIVLADFEGADYDGWTVVGQAFGDHPAAGTLPDQSPVSGYDGKALVDSYLGGDDTRGKLVSPTFTVERPWITFLVGGGNRPGIACVNLVVDDEVVRTATGKNTERLEPTNWDVTALQGRKARLEIVDEAGGGWGHINVDQIEMRDGPRVADPGPTRLWPDFGSLCLASVGGGESHASVSPDALPGAALDGGKDPVEKPAGQRLVGAVRRRVTVPPGAEAEMVFVVAWHFPNMYRESARVGNRYAVPFSQAGEVAAHVAEHLEDLTEATRLWHRTWYDSTLPHWLLDRLHSTVANLATTTAQWWENGRFWGWEGAGCCRGTCGHVWNYEHALARLFPDLERSVREMQDFRAGVGFYPDSGAIGFRGEGWTLWAGDAQGGYVLKALREHQLAPDRGFLERNWPAIRKATEFLIAQDADSDGIIEGQQHQTYDEFYYGPNTMVGSLYLGALRAAEELAQDTGDEAFAQECRRIFERGRERSVQVMYNGEYYTQQVDLTEHPDWQYGNGCLADHMFGQGWAHQVGLGYLYPPDTVKSSLESIWKYDWAPDVGPQNRVHAPERWFAYPGEAGLFTCTWPKSEHMGPRSTRYRNEIWTGIEYQVAGHMAWEGMLTEALAICRGIHERYHPSKHNPFNEIECGDHYARAMASWGVLIGLSGFEHHGPKAHLGFAPRITPEDFRCAYTAAEGWGSYAQTRGASSQTCSVEVRRGRVGVHTMALEVPEGTTVARATVRRAPGGAPADRRSPAVSTTEGEVVSSTFAQEGRRVTITLAEPEAMGAGGALLTDLSW